jgi:tetratricopeptide (TPR) repeat protein
VRKRFAIFGMLVLATAIASFPRTAVANVVVTASIEPRQARPREAATLVVAVQGSQASKRPQIPAVPGLDVQYLGPSTQVSIVDGQMSASLSHRLVVAGTKPGNYAIGPIRVDVAGRVYDAGTVRFEILAPGAKADARAAPGEPELSLTLEVARTAIFVHERIPVIITLRIGAVRVDDLQYPELASESLAVGGFSEPRQRRQSGPQGTEHVVEFRTTVTPLKQGEITLGPALLRLRKAVPGRRRSPFGGIFGDEMQPIELLSDPVLLDVKPLPAEGRPANFSGAVGRFALTTDITPRDVAAGDPVTVKTVIRGDGSLDGASPPAVVETEALRVYPVQTGETANADVRSFEQVVIPKHEGTIEIRGPSFSYFDPIAGRYVTLDGAVAAVTVRASAGAASAPRIVGLPSPGSASPAPALGRDLVFIKDTPGRLRPRDARLWRSTWFWAAQAFPLLLLAGIGASAARRRRLEGNSRFARYTRAGKAARSGLAAARAALARGDTAIAHDGAAAALRDYLAAKLDVPAGAVPELGAARLRAAGVDDAVVASVEGFFARSEHMRFAPAETSPADIAAMLSQAEIVVTTLERSRKIRSLVAVLLLVLLTSALPASATENTEEAMAGFYRGNALYADERYDEAVSAYEAALATGLESGGLLYNLGNARFKTGDLGGAVVAYERALRRIPGDPDLHANLSYARELSGDPASLPPWYVRVLFPIASRVDTETLLFMTAVGWWIAMALLILRMLLRMFSSMALRAVASRMDALLRRAALLAGLAVVVTAASTGYRYVTVESPRWAVVTAGEEAVVRYEPSETGTAYFAAKPGTVVEIQATRPGWVRVRARDGRRGWVERSKISRF